MRDLETCPDCGETITTTGRCGICRPSRRSVTETIAVEDEIDERHTIAEEDAEADEWDSWLEEEDDD